MKSHHVNRQRHRRKVQRSISKIIKSGDEAVISIPRVDFFPSDDKGEKDNNSAMKHLQQDSVSSLENGDSFASESSSSSNSFSSFGGDRKSVV